MAEHFGEYMAREMKENPPVLKHLGWLLPLLPPIIARQDVGFFLGGVVAPHTLNCDDCQGKGPRARMLLGEGGRKLVAYPTAFLLEYLERRGVSMVEQFVSVKDAARRPVSVQRRSRKQPAAA